MPSGPLPDLPGARGARKRSLSPILYERISTFLRVFVANRAAVDISLASGVCPDTSVISGRHAGTGSPYGRNALPRDPCWLRSTGRTPRATARTSA